MAKFSAVGVICLIIGGLAGREFGKWEGRKAQAQAFPAKGDPVDSAAANTPALPAKPDGGKNTLLSTIEQAEAFMASKGIALTEKKEDTGGMVAVRSYSYKAQATVSLAILQFRSAEAAVAWKDMVDRLPFGAAVPVLKDSIAFVLHEGPDEDREAVYSKLGGVGVLAKKGGLPLAKPAEKEKKSEARKPIKLGDSSTLGGVKFTPVQVELKKLKRIHYNFSGKKEDETEDQVLVMTCDLENVSEGQAFKPLRRDVLGAATVTDNYGNRMQSRCTDRDDFQYADHEMKELKPDEKMRSFLVCEKPKVDRAASFVWKVHLITGNQVYFNSFMPSDDLTVQVAFAKTEIK